MSHPLISNFVTELKTMTSETRDPATIIKQVSPILQSLAADTSWVKPAYYECDDDQGFGITILNEEPNNTLLVEAICWLPGRGVAPHDHQTWGLDSHLKCNIHVFEESLGGRFKSEAFPGH